jgi:hypothetical protein
VVEDVYGWHYRNERYMRNEEPLARVAMVYSQQTAHYYTSAARFRQEDHTLGYYQSLVEGRTPFEMVHDRLLDAAHVDKFKVLVFPNIAALSTAQCDQIRQYVERGGSVVATYETSLYDEWGERRADFGLADLFGASYGGNLDGHMQNAYLTLEKDAAGKRHPLLAGLDDAERIIHGASRVVTKSNGSYPNPPLTLVPSYPDLPMEQVYPRVPHTDIPEVFVREVGKGRVVYFPWDIDRIFWEVLSIDHGKLLRNAVTWAANEAPPVAVDGPGTLDVTIWQQKESLTVHLVNLTNPMMMKGPIRELLPVGQQKVRIRMPQGRKAKKVQFLVSSAAPRAQEDNGFLTVTVPSILDHEVIAVDL